MTIKNTILGTVAALAVGLTLSACSTPATGSSAPETATSATAATAKAKAPKLTVSQKNAIEKAESYIELMAFSKSGLVKQLKFEGFPAADAAFAANAIDVNWNEQAAKKAQSYLDMSAFSRTGLIKQLKFEGFTAKQAAHGVKAVGL